jgi:hypothetical protein
MGIKQRLKNIPVLYNALLTILNKTDYFNIRFRRQYPHYIPTERWIGRIDLVKQSSDNLRITVVQDAGKLFFDHQRMHNGLKITLGSYYDYGNTRLLEENKGIHEPQEEFVFQEVLKQMPAGGTMMELGSYWAFYSMWFASQIPDAQCFMVEPDPHKMNFGKLNFKLNRLTGVFDQGFIDRKTDLKNAMPVYSVDYLIQKHNIGFLNILHSDIQGYEFNMLQGAEESIKQRKIGIIFISTHSNELHWQCRDFLLRHDFDIICSADLDETYSWDGVLVGRSKKISGMSSISISLREKR